MISGQQSASWWDAEALIRRLAADEEEVRRGFWRKLRQLVSQLPFAEDLVAAYYCAFDRLTPGHVKAALIGALAYFVLPTDAVPDVLPLVGWCSPQQSSSSPPTSRPITARRRDAPSRACATKRDVPLRGRSCRLTNC